MADTGGGGQKAGIPRDVRDRVTAERSRSQTDTNLTTSLSCTLSSGPKCRTIPVTDLYDTVSFGNYLLSNPERNPLGSLSPRETLSISLAASGHRSPHVAINNSRGIHANCFI